MPTDLVPLRAALHALADPATPDLRRLARHWLAANRSLPPETILAVIDGLIAGDRHDDKTLGAILLGYAGDARAAARPAHVDAWLDRLAGWAQVDALCSNVFQAEDLLADWPAWRIWLRRLARDPNINKRRAALVLLTGPVRRHDDPRLVELAIANIADLQSERAILIAKAVSWLLRGLVARHRAAVTLYLDTHRAALPALAVREVSAKLETGRKTRRPPAISPR